MSDSRVVVADEEYEALAGAAPESSPPWLSEALARLGWSLAEVKQAVLKVTFADAGTPSPIPTLDGGAVAEQLPSVASASIPVDKLSFTNADLMLDVEVADVDGAAVVYPKFTPARGSARSRDRPIAARLQASGQRVEIGDRLVVAGIVILRAFSEPSASQPDGPSN